MSPVTPLFLTRCESLPPREGLAAGDLLSPCVAVCKMDADSGLCLGCFRTLDEIAAWSQAGEDAKWQIWQRLMQRAGVAARPSSTGEPA